MQKAILIQIAAGLLIGGGAGALMGYYGKCTSGTCPLTANPWRGAFVGALMGGLLAYSFGSSRLSASADEATGPAVRIASVEEFDRSVLKADKPVLVDFYSNSCGPCRKLAPTIEKLAEQYDGRAGVCKVNVDRLPRLAGRYGIQGIPTVIFFNKGSEVQRLVGLHPQNAYAEVLDKLSQ
jgi:thioredoxin 1